MRYTALGIGIAFGALFLIFGIGAGISEGFGGIPSPQDCVIIVFGPISMIAATVVAWWHERIGGWWLIVGGIVTAVLFTIRLIDSPMHLLLTSLVYPLPMLVAGVLWVLHAKKLA
jgi:uncharacterized membrane protein HdeD (DUF308 family)